MPAPHPSSSDVDRQLVLAAKLREARTDWRRLAEVRGWVGGHRAPHRSVGLVTDDGIRLAATWLPGPKADGVGAVLVHGFAAHRRKPAYAALADHLAGTVDVLSIDLRGHGASAGRCALGAQEWRDVAAAVAALRRRGLRRVVVVGLSLGGTATAHALARGVEVEGAVLISSAARHWDLSREGMRDLDRMWRSTSRRRVWSALAGFRMDAPDTIPDYPDPVDLVAATTTPLLIVHGHDDLFFGPEHADALAAAAAGPTTLWHEPVGFGHAEDGITPAFCTRLARAVEALGRGQPVPSR